MPDLSLARPLTPSLLEASLAVHMVTKTYTRSSAILPCCHIQSLMIGWCQLIQIRVCPSLPQSYRFSILCNKAEQTHWSCLLESCLHPTHSCLSPIPSFCSSHPHVSMKPVIWGRSRATGSERTFHLIA